MKDTPICYLLLLGFILCFATAAARRTHNRRDRQNRIDPKRRINPYGTLFCVTSRVLDAWMWR